MRVQQAEALGVQACGKAVYHPGNAACLESLIRSCSMVEDYTVQCFAGLQHDVCRIT
jgi:hypothetical protein